MSQQDVLCKCPCNSDLSAAVSAAPTALQGSIWTQIQAIILALEAAGKTINWQAVLALIPLVVAEFTTPSVANLEALALAIAALFNPPSPVPVP